MPRQRLVASPEEYDKRLYAYFDKCEREKEQPTYTGLILALGFTSRQNFYDYSKREEFKELIALTKLMMESEYERIALTTNHASGAIFALKNMGWKDKIEQEHTGDLGGLFKIIHE